MRHEADLCFEKEKHPLAHLETSNLSSGDVRRQVDSCLAPRSWLSYLRTLVGEGGRMMG
jgi:hypothetical protein